MANTQKSPRGGGDSPKGQTGREQYQELNLEQKVGVRSIAEWRTGFARKVDGIGDVSIMPFGTVRLSRNEIIAQVQNGNYLFTGTDGAGSHATLIIEDEATRREVGFESDGKPQDVFSDEKVSEIFAIESQSRFEDALRSGIVTRDEKGALMSAIRRLKINNYAKIRFAEDYTGTKL